MSSFRNLGIPTWVDTASLQASQFIILQDQDPPSLGSFAAVVAGLELLSAAGCVGASIQRWYPIGRGPTAGQPFGCNDRAQFIFRAVDGHIARINVVAPLPGIFVPNSADVDLSRSDVQAFVAAVCGACASSSGSPLVACVQAARISSRGAGSPL